MAENTVVDLECASARTIAATIESGAVGAATVIDKALARIAALNPKVNAFTAVLEERARKKAAELDVARANGESLGPLAGVPYAVKNLYDIEGVVTRAGAKINGTNAPAAATPSSSRGWRRQAPFSSAHLIWMNTPMALRARTFTMEPRSIRTISAI